MGGLTDVEGILVGHWTDLDAATGCTVILPPEGTVASGEVRGGAPGTRETDLLRPGMLVEHVDAILLSGGSAFGLAAADGVVRWLEERGRGFAAGAARVPIVPAAVVFDLDVGDGRVRPDADAGYAACDAAGEDPASGSVGAGTGASVAKTEGMHRAVKGGIGMAVVAEDGVTVGALAVVNALGAIVDDDGGVLAGPREDPETGPGDGGGAGGPEQPTLPGTNTTLGVVATDAALSRERAHLLAVAAHDGLARAVRPAHTRWDGDTVFTLATGRADASQPALERMAEDTLAAAIRAAVPAATAVGGLEPAGG